MIYQEIDGGIAITNTSLFTRKVHTIEVKGVNKDQFEAAMQSYADGRMIQDAFYFLSADLREFIKTGITPEEWDAEFKGDD